MRIIPKVKSLPTSGARRYEQAHFIWNALAAWVKYNKDRTITYGELAEILGYERRTGVTLAHALALVSQYCLYNDLPPISCIVVSRTTKKPGWEGLVSGGSSLKREQRRVWQTPWHLFRTPTVGTFRRVKEEFDWNDVN